MNGNPLASLSNYSQFIAEWLNQPNVVSSTLTVWSDSPYTGIAEGDVFFANDLRLRMREEVDFDAGIIISYGYEVYRGEERLYWYDDFPHPNDPILAPTTPHHKHVPPDIKHNRIPAPNMSFDHPNSDKPKPNRETANLHESTRIFSHSDSRRFAGIRGGKSLLFVQRFRSIGTNLPALIQEIEQVGKAHESHESP